MTPQSRREKLGFKCDDCDTKEKKKKNPMTSLQTLQKSQKNLAVITIMIFCSTEDTLSYDFEVL